MPNTYNLYNLEPQFRKFLLAENVSMPTLNNYLSDFRHFSTWFEAKINPHTEQDFMELINPEVFDQYKLYLSVDNIPLKTINRRLSTMRKFCSFAIQQGWLKDNPAKKVQNKSNRKIENSPLQLGEILNRYQVYLLKDKGIESKNVNERTVIIKEFFSL